MNLPGWREWVSRHLPLAPYFSAGPLRFTVLTPDQSCLLGKPYGMTWPSSSYTVAHKISVRNTEEGGVIIPSYAAHLGDIPKVTQQVSSCSETRACVLTQPPQAE